MAVRSGEPTIFKTLSRQPLRAIRSDCRGCCHGLHADLRAPWTRMARCSSRREMMLGRPFLDGRLPPTLKAGSTSLSAQPMLA